LETREGARQRAEKRGLGRGKAEGKILKEKRCKGRGLLSREKKKKKKKK